MSLLLDALKRAEEAKRAKLAGSADSAASPASPTPRELAADAAREVAPVDSNDFALEDYKEVITPAPRSRPQAPVELALETIAEEKPASVLTSRAPMRDSPALLPTAATTPSRLDATRADAAQSRDTARGVFVAKQPVSQIDDSRNNLILPVIAVVIVAVAAGGWYVWNEVNRVSRPAALTAASRPASSPSPTTAPSLPAALPNTGQPGAVVIKAPDAAQSQNASGSTEPALPPLLPPPAIETPIPVAAKTTPAGPPLTEREALAKKLKDAPNGKEAPVTLRLARSVDAPVVSQDLADAYTALKNGDYLRARALYAKLVMADPLNLDAQLGIATVFARRGESTLAAAHYRQVLTIDPRNGTAMAGLVAVSDAKSPTREVELKTLLGRTPNSSTLQFSLGNHYASERRWVEAQQAYFEAYRLESGNADFAYNLAVSLDHLKQPRLAMDYYQKSLALLTKSGGQFESAAVQRRIKELAGETAVN